MSEVFKQSRGHVTKLSLNRPERLNGFTDALADKLLTDIQEASADLTTKVLVIAGQGRAFSAGMDLTDLTRNGLEAIDIRRTLEAYYNPIAEALANASCVTICELDGIAAGGAASLALSCDVILASRNARLVSAFSRIGLVPDCGGTWLAVNKLGVARAIRFSILEEAIESSEMVELGLCPAVSASSDELDTQVAAYCERLKQVSCQAVLGTRLALAHAANTTLSAQLEYETKIQDELIRSQDFQEGVAAFFEKRAPNF